MADWLILARESGHALMWAGGLLTGWWTYAFRMRSIARQEVRDAGRMAMDLVRAAALREASLTTLAQAYEAELLTLRRLRWITMDTLSTVQAHALAARLIVRELDARLGLPRRDFVPLPPFPETDQETGAEAADTAEPREDTRTDNRPATPAGAGLSMNVPINEQQSEHSATTSGVCGGETVAGAQTLCVDRAQ
ncbi:MAG: hypothetical protein ABF856_04970 [Acetobacter aceti]